MSTSLLQTKFYIPHTRPELVSRPRLIEQLNAGLHRKLTLVSAPAGFGKTTLVSEWVHRRGAVTAPVPAPLQVAWLSLDESDNDPTRFLIYFVAALQTLALPALGPVKGSGAEGIETDIGKVALTMLQSPQPPPTEAILTTLINEITAIPDRIVLVLDDYHLIDSQPIHDALTFLLEHLPPQLHLVIATREDPQLPLARLRARGQLTELRATDLRFTSSKAAEFLNQAMGLDLAAEDIAALETQTEGWIAGLQLASLALQGTISMQGRKDASNLIKSFTGSHRFVLDYLVEEVLEQQSERVQTFLLQTAILDRLTGSLCDAVRFGQAKSPIGQENGQTTLEMLERANLFIVPLDDERHWYRYHHLFADLLRHRLRQTQAEQLPILHQSASDWYEQNGFVNKAIEHALRGENFERATFLIQEQADVVWGLGEHDKLWRWIEKLPNEILLSRPQLCILQASNQLIDGQQDAAKQSLLTAENALDKSTELATETTLLEYDSQNDASRMKIRGRIAAIRAELAFYQGDIKGLYTYSHQALEYLPAQDLAWRSAATVALGDAYSFMGDIEKACQFRSEAVALSQTGGNIYMILIASMKMAVTLRQQGRLQQVIEICQQRLQLAKESGMSQTDVAGCSLAIWGEVLAELNDLDGAIDLVRKGVELSERGGDVAMLNWSYICWLRVLFSSGDMAGAEKIIQKMKELGQKSDVPPWITNQVAAWQTRIWLAQDKLETAVQWAEKRGLIPGKALPDMGEFEYGVLARILIAQGRLDEAITLLQRLLKPAEAGGHITRAISILRLQVLAFQAKGDTTRAMTILEKALTLAKAGGFVRIFVDEGPPMARLLYKALSRGIVPDYVRQLLAAFPVAEPEQSAPSTTQAPKSELIEPLSEREIQVLQFIAKGLTNREIAARLYLSPNTIKVHTRNIYGKLDVNSRTQAVARARTLGVLPST